MATTNPDSPVKPSSDDAFDAPTTTPVAPHAGFDDEDFDEVASDLVHSKQRLREYVNASEEPTPRLFRAVLWTTLGFIALVIFIAVSLHRRRGGHHHHHHHANNTALG